MPKRRPRNPEPETAKVRKIVPALLTWFNANARDLPWRRTRDPYAIWVSEIMLQQTQVKTVIPYWERWMRELPSIASAANAAPAKLHKLWEGLGYYTRVRNLQKAAQQIIAQHASRFPESFDDILALSGIGRYTAGAIASIAFNQPRPILDGNVIRVLTRIFGIAANPREKKTNTRLWQLAEKMVDHAHARWGERPREPGAGSKLAAARRESRPANACSHLNQSLMELGALICTPRSPNCAVCPVRKCCVARKENRQDQLPKLGKRAVVTERRFLAFVVERSGKFLVRQRPAGVVNAHLWEFLNAEVGVGGDKPERSAAKELGLKPTGNKPIHSVKHSITRYRVTLQVWTADLGGPSFTRPKLHSRWLSVRQLHQLAFTSAHKKILASLSARREG